MSHKIRLKQNLRNFLKFQRNNKFTRTKAQKQQTKTPRKQTKIREKCPRQFSSVKVRVLCRDWLICEITRAACEYKKNTKGVEEAKKCYLKFKSERDFLPDSFFLAPSSLHPINLS